MKVQFAAATRRYFYEALQDTDIIKLFIRETCGALD